jgi:hypothetical protein
MALTIHTGGNMIHVAEGIALLVFGRRLFWLFVGIAGFIAGFDLAQQYLALQPDWLIWGAGILCGLVGILLAIFFQRLAVGLGGFAAGGYIALHLTSLMGATALFWIYLVGGIIGAVLLYLLFDWALILLSCIAGASLVVKSLQWDPLYKMLLYVCLIIAGAAFQAVWMHKRSLVEKRRDSGNLKSA